MDLNHLKNSDYLDILFEGRNKKYGGYELRRNYPKRVKRSLLALAGIAIAVAAYGVATNRPVAVEAPKLVMKEVVLAEPPPIDPKKPPPPPPPAEAPPPVKPTVKFTPPVIAKDEEVKEDEKPPEVKELKEASAGIKTEKGDINGIDPGIISNPGEGTGVTEAAPPPPPAVFTYVEQMPEFNGSVNKYLSDNIVYPDAAREAGIDGRVVIKFVVSEDGSVTGAVVEKSVNGSLDAEALRVVKAMPKWKPGKQNGKPVKVYYRVPVKFTLQ